MIFRQVMALGPLAIFVLVLALVYLARRPQVINGMRETAALGIALCGLVLLGPLELFLPVSALHSFGGYVWLLLLSLYGMGVLLLGLVQRPRITVLNIRKHELRSIVVSCLESLDPKYLVQKDTLLAPGLGMEFTLEPFEALKTVSLVALGPEQNFASWAVLEKSLAKRLQEVPSKRGPLGWSLLALGLALTVFLSWQWYAHPVTVASQLQDVLLFR